ncbi:hypothetical protein BJX66DRAFT_316515 [Aspergillus keveii]|uniref:Uncharacterized protein n=1 Tax=Aspergillus keveii TaxID=714993 RepID=A0ABR4FMN4_9EURO
MCPALSAFANGTAKPESMGPVSMASGFSRRRRTSSVFPARAAVVSGVLPVVGSLVEGFAPLASARLAVGMLLVRTAHIRALLEWRALCVYR